MKSHTHNSVDHLVDPGFPSEQPAKSLSEVTEKGLQSSEELSNHSNSNKHISTKKRNNLNKSRVLRLITVLLAIRLFYSINPIHHDKSSENGYSIASTQATMMSLAIRLFYPINSSRHDESRFIMVT
jgi:hypothetical protein